MGLESAYLVWIGKEQAQFFMSAGQHGATSNLPISATSTQQNARFVPLLDPQLQGFNRSELAQLVSRMQNLKRTSGFSRPVSGSIQSTPTYTTPAKQPAPGSYNGSTGGGMQPTGSPGSTSPLPQYSPPTSLVPPPRATSPSPTATNNPLFNTQASPLVSQNGAPPGAGQAGAGAAAGGQDAEALMMLQLMQEITQLRAELNQS